MQGLYGPYTLTERVLQRIWLKQDLCAADLRTVSGKQLRVLNSGRWNLLGGPDFKGARLELDGDECLGDVEVHFNWRDWYAHGHELNPEFNQVILHVVLHHGAVKPKAVDLLSGQSPETLVLMPYLEQDLEAYATELALLEMEQLDELEWVSRFRSCPLSVRWSLIHSHATKRWQQKLGYAQRRLERQEWSVACHQSCLEVLGYHRNREPMARIAGQFSLEEFVNLTAEELYASQAGRWRLQGTRPANHPKLRIQQYQQVLARLPNWPVEVLEWLRALPVLEGAYGTRQYRQTVDLRRWIDALRVERFGGVISSSRFNTLILDALLPLATAAGVRDFQGYWFHWPAGDLPDSLRRFLKHAGLTSAKQPMCNGLGQGALSLFIHQGS
ncbi:conserved hypothetical protein [Coraliomargarita akajimensis DSM 45221]|uniref:DUF2851 domain-containing protein n=2 Tax=Coraliomargarita TaxID=442430 RepID=D5EQC4_CORAD|nr:conserved hypothetical protein [Coraliomargarita akajimensis DSM 45221]